MASQVLSGSSNVSYTNNTGQNVRIVINFMKDVTNISWAGITHTLSSSNIQTTIGRNLAFYGRPGSEFATAINCWVPNSSKTEVQCPTEIMLSTGQTFSATCGVYNVIVIPEAG